MSRTIVSVSKAQQQIRSVKGTRDLLPSETALWQRIEDEARRVLRAYHFGEIRTPLLEATALFARSVGEDTDIVTKEMYTFEDHERRDLAQMRGWLVGLQPDATPVAEFKRWVERFLALLREAMQRGEVPGTPDNERILQDVPANLGRINHPVHGAGAAAGTDPGADSSASQVYWRIVIDSLGKFLLGDSLSLRPEATASVVRAYIERSLYNEGGVHKLYYIGPMFRRDRPQKGRYRQFYQIGAEVLGSEHPAVDVEVLEMLALFLERVGIPDSKLLINSVGDKNCRPAYIAALREALGAVKGQMCGDCQRRAETNPLRVLDCKVPADQPIIEKLPRMLDYLCAECRQHFDQVLAELGRRGLAYKIAPRLVRGLDYYTRTTFEITSGALGAQNALLGGGRYDGLSEMLGGPRAPGFGFAIGEDRLALAVEATGGLEPGRPLVAYVAWLGASAAEPASRLARELRERGFAVEVGYQPAKLKKSLGAASKLGARFAVIIGEGELASGVYQVKDLDSGQQQAVDPALVADYLAERIGAPAPPASL